MGIRDRYSAPARGPAVGRQDLDHHANNPDHGHLRLACDCSCRQRRSCRRRCGECSCRANEVPAAGFPHHRGHEQREAGRQHGNKTSKQPLVWRRQASFPKFNVAQGRIYHLVLGYILSPLLSLLFPGTYIRVSVGGSSTAGASPKNSGKFRPDASKMGGFRLSVIDAYDLTPSPRGSRALRFEHPPYDCGDRVG